MLLNKSRFIRSKLHLISRMFSESNPLLNDWVANYGLPPFNLIKHHHFKPAIETGMANQLAELNVIANNSEPPTFSNTIEAFDACGMLLGKVLAVFSNLTSSHSPPELQAVELELSGPLAAHRNAIYTYPGLFCRIDSVHAAVSANPADLNSEQIRLTNRIHLEFIRAGAKFDNAAQDRYKTVMMELATLTTEFSQNILADESSYSLKLYPDKDGDLNGLPQDLLDASKQLALDKGNTDGCYVINLSRSFVEPFLTFSENREHRKNLYLAWISRGNMNTERTNIPIIAKILNLRIEQAKMHGYKTYAEYATADTMAQNPTSVRSLLQKVWNPAIISCKNELSAIEQFVLASDPTLSVIKSKWNFVYSKYRYVFNSYMFS